MKIRHGFVSNSSSSSFCVFGIHFSKDRECVLIENLLGIDPNAIVITQGCDCDIDRDALKKKRFKFCPSCGSELFIEQQHEFEELGEDLYKAASKLGFYCQYWQPESDAPYGWYIGYDCINKKKIEGEAQLEEMKKAMDKLREIFGKDEKIIMYSGSCSG